MTTTEITTRLAGTTAEYHVLKVYVNGVFDANRVHTSVDRSYLVRKADEIVRFSVTKFF